MAIVGHPESPASAILLSPKSLRSPVPPRGRWRRDAPRRRSLRDVIASGGQPCLETRARRGPGAPRSV